MFIHCVYFEIKLFLFLFLTHATYTMKPNATHATPHTKINTCNAIQQMKCNPYYLCSCMSVSVYSCMDEYVYECIAVHESMGPMDA